MEDINKHDAAQDAGMAKHVGHFNALTARLQDLEQTVKNNETDQHIVDQELRGGLHTVREEMIKKIKE